MQSGVIDTAFWKGRRVLLTGHTGFKGAWLAHWLARMNAQVSGIALEPATPSLFQLLDLEHRMQSVTHDIRDGAFVDGLIAELQPEIVFHLAAQSLVRKGYETPVATYETNVMGTVHLLDAVRRAPQVRAVVVVTSDKCYANHEWPWPYRETDSLGGADPYSSSKAAAEIVTQAYRDSFFRDGAAIATARAGNVIGGGDWSADRLVPDIVAAIIEKRGVQLRNPHAIRPWQHVLEPLSGYLLLAQRLVENRAHAQAWNFGPEGPQTHTVAQLAEQLTRELDGSGSWSPQPGDHPHETHVLRVDASKARYELGWRARLHETEAISWTAQWYNDWRAGGDVLTRTNRQIEEYLAR